MISAAPSFLLDSNIPIYAYDGSDPGRQARAREIILVLARARLGVLTTQVLAEFYVNVRRKIPQPLSPERAERVLRLLRRLFPVVSVSPDVVCEAARACRQYQLSYWDGQIWASAKLGGSHTILSEDLPGQSPVEGIEWKNPLLLTPEALRSLLTPQTLGDNA